jgi:hypothetical protein
MNFRFSFLLLITISIIAASCNSNKEKKRAAILFEKGKGIFRNIDFDMDIETVQQNEKAPLANSADDYLRYEIENINNTNEFLQIEYMFDKQRLDRIMVYYKVAKKEDAEKLFNEVHEHYVKKFGESADNESGWLTWELKDKGGMPGNIEIMISKESKPDMFGVDIEMVKYYKDEQKPATSLLKK